MRISIYERRYIEMIYKGKYKTNEVASTLMITKGKVLNMKLRIFKKLAVNSWYNAIRRSFELNILKRENYSSFDIDDEINKTTERIKKINFSNNNDTLVKLKIFFELVDFYNKYEYETLLKQFNEDKNFNDSKKEL